MLHPLCDGDRAILLGTKVDSPHNLVAVAVENTASVCEPTGPPHTICDMAPMAGAPACALPCSGVGGAANAAGHKAWQRLPPGEKRGQHLLLRGRQRGHDPGAYRPRLLAPASA